ncbi:rhodanese-like domain-containing protein [Halodesulfovibrio sp.]|jgi:rhodanese-related sulfurtransferase/rubrerythrin|uniref:rhodanese-like domain-containing protein n=1 Tax=Halodesulfovibrio sp. TaxID=1912772 RepID=UPI0025E0C168|nr:rhodanese-like domain-containing protein [Halodesulfovibrio sp.]MCT4626444.1 rhodanese-like domain-containing protein [Halodesulfovibrio sp.]
MRWKQFLTPVESISTENALTMLGADDSIQLVDVRQPAEYDDGHIAGAKHIPLGELLDRANELDKEKPVMVYCAVGGRSRVAAQLLSGNEFNTVYNLTGGFNIWEGWESIGDYEQGLELFNGLESLEEFLIVAYRMELALGEFYTDMSKRVANQEAASLFAKLAAIEAKHKTNIIAQYTDITKKEFPNNIDIDGAFEGGLTTAEYISRLGTDMEKPLDIIDFAMSVEGQAMDLYIRAAEKAPDEQTKKALLQIASEEKAHLNSLAAVLDSLYASQR